MIGSIAETPERTAARLRWHREVAIVLAFYGLYSVVRNQFGSASVTPHQAVENALRVIRVERALNLFIELPLQEAFLGWPGFLRLWNIFYGSLHFVVTGGVMVWLYRQHPHAYRRWRTTLGAMTGLALLGFSLFPLMPPRLLPSFGPFGGGRVEFPFVDTLAHFGGLWSFDSESMATISNQYAAMPSLHIGWSTWCATAIYPRLRSRPARGLALAYPLITLFAVMVTGNHYWIDGLGGLAAFGVGWLIAGRLITVDWSAVWAASLLRRPRR